LKDQISTIESQIVEQQVNVKAAAPDKGQLQQLEKTVAAYKKGKTILFFILI